LLNCRAETVLCINAEAGTENMEEIKYKPGI